MLSFRPLIRITRTRVLTSRFMEFSQLTAEETDDLSGLSGGLKPFLPEPGLTQTVPPEERTTSSGSVKFGLAHGHGQFISRAGMVWGTSLGEPAPTVSLMPGGARRQRMTSFENEEHNDVRNSRTGTADSGRPGLSAHGRYRAVHRGR